MRARLAPSRRLALAFVLALGGVLLAALLAPSARVALRTPFVERGLRSTPATVELEGRGSRHGTRVFRAALLAADSAALERHDAIEVFLDGAGPAGRRFRAARLELQGTACAFATREGGTLASGAAVVLERGTGCRPAHGGSGTAGVFFSVEAEGDGGVALLAFDRAEGAQVSPLQVVPARGRAALDLRGAFLDYPQRLPRVVLLAHMWRLPPGGHVRLLWLLALAVLTACAAVLVFPTRPVAPGWPLPDARTLARGGFGAAFGALSLALLYVVIAPPLSGPDEPYHLLGFAELTHDGALARDTVLWMGETHLWRIRQQPSERFRSIDVSRPFVVPDDQLRPTEVAMRSAITTRLWRAAAPLVRGPAWPLTPDAGPAPRALLALRLVNALVFALFAGASAALAITLVAEPFAQWLVYPLFVVPALPFFAMHVSETAVLCGVYALVAACVAILALDGPRTHWAGLPLGFGAGLMLAGGRSPWPLAALVGAMLLTRAALGTRGPARSTRSAVVFWGGLGVGASVFYLLRDEAYGMMTETYVIYFTGFVPAALRSLVLWALRNPLALAGLAFAGALLERRAAGLRARLELGYDARVRALASRVAATLAILVVVSLVASLVVRYPQVPLEPRVPLTASERLAAVLATALTTFRLQAPDFLLASSFWVGFGWLDTMPGAAFQALLVALTGGSLAALLAAVASRRQVRRLLWLLAAFVGALASLAVYTLSTQDRVTALQGRYLIGWYLCLLALCGSALVLERRNTAASGIPAERTGAVRAAWLLAIAGLVHVYCLVFILRRYF